MASVSLPSGHTYVELDDTNDGNNIKKLWYAYTDGVIKLNPEGWILPKNYVRFAKQLHDFKWQPSDIIVLTYPKSGTTWTQEIIWNLVKNPNLDNPEMDVSLDARFPNFEADMFLSITGAPEPEVDGDPMVMFRTNFPGKDYKIDGLLLSLASITPPPRMFKTHLAFSLYPKDLTSKCKVIYVLREPRDVITSLFHYSKLQILYDYKGDLDEFVDQVVNDKIIFGPYWQHLKLAWQRRNDPNLCIIYYEDLKSDVIKEIKRIDKFLGTNRSDAQFKKIADFVSFDQMKSRTKNDPPTSNYSKYFNKDAAEDQGGFFRKGEIGDWKNLFNEKQVNKINAWMTKNLVNFGNDFKYKV